MINKKILHQIKKNKKNIFNIFWSNLVSASMLLFSLGISIVFTRLTSKEFYGSYILTFAIFNIMYIFTIPGTQSTVLRLISNNKEGIYIQAIKKKIIGSLIGSVLLIFISFYYFQTDKIGISIALLIGSILFPFYFSFRIWEPYIKGKEKFKRLFILTFSKLLITFFIITISLINKMSLGALFGLYILTNSILDIAIYSFYKKRVKNKKIENDWISQSVGLSVLRFSQDAFAYIDKIIISIFMNLESVAIYALIMKSGEVFFNIINSTYEVVVPKIYKGNKIKIRHLIIISFLSISFYLLIPLVKHVVIFLFTDEYLIIVDYIKIYLLVIPIYIFSRSIITFFIKHKLTFEINVIKVSSSILTTFLYIVLIPRYGLMGGVISSIFYFISQTLIAFYFLITNKKLRGNF